MFEQVLPHVYRIPVPLPENPLRELNSYLILGEDRNLLIDTGFRRPECRAALFAALRTLGAGAEHTDVLLTHLHSDHSGLAPEVIGPGRHIYVGHGDLDALACAGHNTTRWETINAHFSAEGYPASLLESSIVSNPARAMAPLPCDAYLGLADGEIIEAGGYRLKCVPSSGHTPGHMCYWLEREQAMFLGDHVLFDITPNITAWPGVEDSLGDYLSSLRAIRAYDVRIPLPAHRASGDFHARVDALLAHHQLRLAEALDVVRRHPGEGAYVLAGYMTWKIRANSWDDFPPPQKWFAVGECMSHLDYLRTRGQIRRERDSRGLYHYFVKEDTGK